MSNLLDEIAKSEFEDLKIEFTERSKTITEKFIVVDGKEYDLDDMWEDVSAIGDQVTFQADEPHAKLFLKIGVLASAGNSRWGSAAVAGPNYVKFRKILSEKKYGKRSI